jgi:hypothetical protein
VELLAGDGGGHAARDRPWLDPRGGRGRTRADALRGRDRVHRGGRRGGRFGLGSARARAWAFQGHSGGRTTGVIARSY